MKRWVALCEILWIILCAYAALALPADRFTEAVDCLSRSQYEEAAALFETLGDYPEAGRYASYCRALKAGEDGRFTEAVSNFEMLGSFLDSRMLAVYFRARQYEALENYELAEKSLASVSLFRDSSERMASYPEKIRARDYRNADKREKSGELNKALEGFASLDGYKDSRDRADAIREKIRSADYAKAESLLKEGSLAQAYDLWNSMPDYRDSTVRAAEIREPAAYEKGIEAAEAGAFQVAHETFAGLGDYKDAARKAYLFDIAAISQATKPLRGQLFAYRYNGLWGIVDWRENSAVPASWNDVKEMDPSGLLAVRRGTLYGCTDRTGKEIIPCAYMSVQGTGNGTVVAADTRGKWTLFSRAGAELCDRRWDGMKASGTGEPIAVRTGEKWGFINNDGQVVVEPVYQETARFHEGFCAVRRGNSWGYVDSTGNEAIPPFYEKATDFENGMAGVYTAEKGWNIVRKDGTRVYFVNEGYEAAVQLMEAGRYAEAEDAFLRADDPRMVREVRYRKAKELLSEGEYGQAGQIFSDLHGYRDADDLLLKTHYSRGESLYLCGAYDEAAEAFKLAGEYADAVQRAVEAAATAEGIRTYQKAEELMSEGKNAEAYDAWLSIADYKDSLQRAALIIQPAFYQKGLLAAQRGDYRKAFEYFSRLGSYEDSARKADVFSTAVLAEETKYLGEGLFGCRLGEHWGIADWKQNRVTSAVWDDVEREGPGGLLIVHKKGSYGCADRTGREIIPCEYSAIPGFSGDTVLARDASGKWTLFSVAGEERCEQRWDDMKAFGEKDPIAVQKDDLWGFIDHEGNTVIEAVYTEISAFKEELCAVKNADGWGFIDRLGREAVQPAYETVTDFDAGRAKVYAADSGWHVISKVKTGNGIAFVDDSYNDGLQMLKEGRYDKAQEAFALSGDRQMENETRYRKAEELLAQMNEGEAEKIFRELGDYRDSEERVSGFRYQEGIAMFDAGDYEGAAEAFDDAGEYRDAPERLAEALKLSGEADLYAAAEEMLEDGEIVEAYDTWVSLGRYRDSKARAAAIEQEVIYAKGIGEAENGRYLEAFNRFSALGDYLDSARKAEIFAAVKLADETKPLCGAAFGYCLDGLWGIANWKNNTIRNACWESVEPMNTDTRIRVTLGGKAGLTDDSGNVLTKMEYEEIDIFGRYQLARARRADGYGYLDMKGEETIPCRFLSVSGFDGNGIVKVQTDEGYGLMDHNGRMLVPCVFAEIRAYEAGRAKAKDAEGKWALLSTEGKELCRERWDEIKDEQEISGEEEEEISEDEGIIRLRAVRRGRLWGYIDLDGQVVAQPAYSKLNSFHEGFCAVQKSGLWGFIDSNGQEAVPVIYRDVTDFSDGQAAVRLEDGSWSIIRQKEDGGVTYIDDGYNKGLQLLIDGRYDEAETAFEQAGNSYMVLAVRYKKAEAYLEEQKTEEALGVFSSLGNYSNAQERVLECLYTLAVQKEAEGNQKEAEAALIRAGIYAKRHQFSAYKDLDERISSDDSVLQAVMAPYRTVGSIVSIGRYEQDNDISNGPEPIEWVVVDVRKNSALLISRYALEIMPYNELYTDMTWEMSSLRGWLNNGFALGAFDPSEIDALATSYVTNTREDGNGKWRTKGGRATRDKVFLLSCTQMERYLKTESEKRCQPTEYASAQAASNGTGDQPVCWWLRSPGRYQDEAAAVNAAGEVESEYVGNAAYGVRPAVWLDLSADWLRIEMPSAVSAKEIR